MDWMGRNDEGTRNMGKFRCEACFQNREQVGRDEREEGTCWRNQDGEIGGDWVSACGPCLCQIRRADKTGRRRKGL